MLACICRDEPAAGPDYQGDRAPDRDEATDVCDEIDGLLEQIEVGEGKWILAVMAATPLTLPAAGGKKGYVNLNFVP